MSRLKVVELPDFLTYLFYAIDAHGVQYAIARNYERLGNGSPGRDIDILLRKRDVDVIICFIKSAGVSITGIVRRQYVTSLFCVGVHWGERLSLGVDLVHRLDYRGIEYLSIEGVLNRRQVYCSGSLSFWIPESIDEAIITLMENFLVGGHIPEKYKSTIADGFRGSAEAENRLAQCVGRKRAKQMMTYIEHGDVTGLLAERRNIVWAFFIRGVGSKPVITVKRFIIHLYTELNIRWFGRNRKTICFLGPDGAGKSTLIEYVVSRLKFAAGGIEVRHLKPVMLFKRRVQSRGIVTSPHALPSRGWIMSNCKLLLWWIELWADRIARSDRTLKWEVYDRCMWDVLVDPKRYRFCGSKKLLSVLLRTIPKIDKIIIITSSPDLIRKRKMEVSLKETIRQDAAYRFLSEKYYFDLVINDSSLENAGEKCVSLLSALTAQR